MLSSWRTTLFFGVGGNILVLAFNLGFILWAIVHHGLEDNSGLLYEGKCSKVRQMSVGLHFVINVFSMGLLVASNYCLQCLSAPTRGNIDRAHRKGSWVDIGVPSVRNLLFISRSKSFLWILLFLCSLPLHFIYNSTIFSVVSANDYNIFVGASSLGQKDVAEITLSHNINETTFWPSFVQLYHAAQNRSLSKLTPSDCFNTYNSPFPTTYANVLVTTDGQDESDTGYLALSHEVVFQPHPNDTRPHERMCRGQNNSACINTIWEGAESHAWNINGARVTGCLSETSPARCKLAYSLPLMITVIALNFIHAAIMLVTAIQMPTPILTVGDAIASFMNRADRITQNYPLLSRDKINELDKASPSSMSFDPIPRRWYTSVSYTRWASGIIPALLFMSASIALLLYGFNQVQNRNGIWNTTLSTPSIQTLITPQDWPQSLLINTLIANTPQILFSILYLTSNGIVTTMTLAAEWSNYAILRRGLRVSTSPAISQRSSSYISLPPCYCLPLVAICALLHFLGSQSLFLMDVQVYTAMQERDQSRDFVTVGYSPSAIIVCLAIGATLLIALLALSTRKFASGMPVAGSCSLAIAAACHPPTNEEPRRAEGNPQAGYFPLKWGNRDGYWGFSWE